MSEASGVLFPLYFLERWREQEGYSPVVVYNKLLRDRKIGRFSLCAVMVMVVALLVFNSILRHTPHEGIILAVALASMLVALALGTSTAIEGLSRDIQVRRFKDALDEVAYRLVMKPERLAQMTVDDARVEALSILKELAQHIRAMESETFSESHLRYAKNLLSSCGEDHYGVFLRWKLIPPTGWEFYLRS